MTLKTRMVAVSLMVVSLFTFASRVADAITVNIVSDTTWTVTDANGTYLGNAQNVCLFRDENSPSAAVPPNCPAGATVYGYPFPGWIADLSAIPGATWIWAPNITGATSPAANAEFTFQTYFYLCDAPQGGTISIAADDFAEVFLNGATTPVVTSQGHSTLSTVNIPSTALVQGLNIIQVRVRNALDPSDCASGEYRCNPAGFVFAASFSDALPALPTCTSGGNTFTVGQFEPLPCPPGRTGSASRPCICIGRNGVWGPVDNSGCVVPPTTCTGMDGMTRYAVDANEPLPCATGFSGTATRTCSADGTWGPTDSSGCVRPPTMCTGADGVTPFGVNATETLPCAAGQTGSAVRTCGADGSWGPTDSSACVTPPPPPAMEGEWCGDKDQGVVRTCPAGTTCSPRYSKPPRPAWCGPLQVVRFLTFGLVPNPSDCDPVATATTDWYCLR